MARLFLGPRELNFFSDITKELLKDVVGQRIIYYPISELRTKMHDVYNESMQKVYDNPIELDALVDTKFQQDTKIDLFGIDQQYKLEAFVHYKDTVEKGINICIGDFFSYSSVFYEITETMTMRTIYGQAEHKDGIKIIGTKARDGQFETILRGPTDISYSDPDAVQKNWQQQRGLAENKSGVTGDVRDLVRDGVLDPPLAGAREVSEAGGKSDNSTAGSAFYDEDE